MNKNKPPTQSIIVPPRPVVKHEELKQPISAPSGNPGETAALDDYDQMIFNQFMDEDEGEMMARQMQDEMYGGAKGGQQQDPSLGIRKADSENFG